MAGEVSKAEFDGLCEHCKEKKILWAYYPYCSEQCKYLGELFKRIKTDPH